MVYGSMPSNQFEPAKVKIRDYSFSNNWSRLPKNSIIFYLSKNYRKNVVRKLSWHTCTKEIINTVTENLFIFDRFLGDFSIVLCIFIIFKGQTFQNISSPGFVTNLNFRVS